MNFLPHSFAHTVEEGWTTTKDDILEKVFPYINVTLKYGIIAIFVDTLEVKSSLLRLEEDFSCLEPFFTNKDLSSIR